jgi:hypothetical protein
MDKDIDIYEFEWWNAFVGFIILLVISVFILWICYYEFGRISEVSKHPWRFFNPKGYFKLIGILGPGLMGLVSSVFGFLSIRVVPRLIVFKESTIVITFPSGQKRTFLYSDISSIEIRNKTSRGKLFKSWSPFNVRLYFNNNTVKIFFDQNRLFNFPFLLESFRKQGIGHLIKQM